MRTERSTFAIKRMVLDTDRAEFVDNVEEAYGIECEAYAAGIPMAAPVPDLATGRCLALIDGSLVRVHRWLDGRTPQDADVDVSLSERAGRMLATIHATNLTARGEPERGPSPISADRFRALAYTVADLSPEVASQLHSAATDLAQLHARTYAPAPFGDPVVSHADLHPSNCVILADGTLAAIDWDTAGTVLIQCELAQVALDWATTPTLTIDIRRLVATVNAYHAAGGQPLIACPQIFGSWVGSWIWWLDHNVQHRIRREIDVRKGSREALKALVVLSGAVRFLDHWLALLEHVPPE